MITLTLEEARRLAVIGQLLSAPQPESLLDVVRWLGSVQMDPTNVVSRSEHLVLWSRLGRRYRIEDLDRSLWKERSLFEYYARIVPTSDYAIYRETMRKYPDVSRGERTRHRYIRAWLKSNAKLRQQILFQLRRKGPLCSREMDKRLLLGGLGGGMTGKRNKLGKCWRFFGDEAKSP